MSTLLKVVSPDASPVIDDLVAMASAQGKFVRRDADAVEVSAPLDFSKPTISEALAALEAKYGLDASSRPVALRNL